MASRQVQGFIPRATNHASLLTNPHHSPCLPDIQTSFSFFFFTVSIHLFRGLPNERLPAHSYIDSLGNSITLYGAHTRQSLRHSAQLPYPCIMDSSKPLRLSICTALILDLSFHNIVLLPCIRTATRNDSCKTLAQSSCKPLGCRRRGLKSLQVRAGIGV